MISLYSYGFLPNKSYEPYHQCATVCFCLVLFAFGSCFLFSAYLISRGTVRLYVWNNSPSLKWRALALRSMKKIQHELLSVSVKTCSPQNHSHSIDLHLGLARAQPAFFAPWALSGFLYGRNRSFSPVRTIPVLAFR